MTKAVIFDIGNVLVDWNVRYLFERLEPDAARLKYFLSEVVPLSWHTRFDLGTSMREGVKARAELYPDYEELLDAYEARFDETIGGVIEGSLQILKDLDEKGYPLFALSNFPKEQWDIFEASYAFTRVFADKVISGREGIAKPDQAIYELAHQRFGVEPAETLFIDDRQENIDAALTYGFQAYHFQGADGLGDWLSANGWLQSKAMAL